MKLKVLNILLICCFGCSTFFAQSVYDANKSDDYVLAQDSLTTKDKLHYNFAMGVGFSNSSSYGNSFNTYYNPSITYDVNSRFTLGAGLMYVNNTVNNFPIYSDYQYSLFSGNISEYFGYVNGQYKVNQKLSVGGSVFYNLTNYNAYNGLNMNNPNKSALDHIGYSANFKYKVSKSITIQGSISSGNRYSPYNQYGNGFNYGSGFGMGNSFSSPFRTW